MARLTEQAYIKGLNSGYALAKAQYEEIIAKSKGANMQIDVDEMIRHTKNMAEIAKRNNDKSSELFFHSVVLYIEQYIDTFCKEHQ